MRTPRKVKYLELYTTCVNCGGVDEWNNLMAGAVRADHKQLDRLIKKHLPDLYRGLFRNLYNPYNYFKTKDHLIMVHSGIEYFLNYEL